MKRVFQRPWLVTIAVFALSLLPLIAVLAGYRKQARGAEAMLFERGAEIVEARLRLSTARQSGWLNTLRTRLSGRIEAPEHQLQELLAPGSWLALPEYCRAIAYIEFGASGEAEWRWQRARESGAPNAKPLLSREQLAEMRQNPPTRNFAQQVGEELVIALPVADAGRRTTRGWLVAAWTLRAFCADPGLKIVADDRALAVRPLSGAPEPGERELEIREGDVRWRAAASRGPDFARLFPRVSELIIAITGVGFALALAALAGFVTRASELRAALEGQRELAKMKDRLLHSVSHELRTPLSVVLSCTDLLENYDGRLTSERRAELFAQIREGNARMETMIGQMLMFGRIDAGRWPVQHVPLDLAALCHELAHEAETAGRGHCTITVEAPEKMPVRLDPALLREALGNLLSNAVKFSPAGGVVQLATHSKIDGVEISVRDSGPGIPPDEIPRLGEPYFRGNGSTGVPGTGLGLAIARRSVELLGGRLKIESDAAGTTAALLLPKTA